jgi:hypothetical protein
VSGRRDAAREASEATGGADVAGMVNDERFHAGIDDVERVRATAQEHGLRDGLGPPCGPGDRRAEVVSDVLGRPVRGSIR